jgi:hypothetical protein
MARTILTLLAVLAFAGGTMASAEDTAGTAPVAAASAAPAPAPAADAAPAEAPKTVEERLVALEASLRKLIAGLKRSRQLAERAKSNGHSKGRIGPI